MRIRLRWVFIWLLACATVATAVQKKADNKKEPQGKEGSKPKSAKWLVQRDNLWYLLHEPELADPNERVPLLVVTESKRGQAKQSFDEWLKCAEADGIFLATLSFPREWKGDRQRPVADLVVKLLKEHKTIDRRALVLLGVASGGNDALDFIAGYPQVFRTAIILSPDKFPNFKTIDRGSLRLSPATTSVHVTLSPRAKALRKEFEAARRDFYRRHVRLTDHAATGGAFKAGPAELELALELLRAHYSPAKRAQHAEAWRKEAEQAKERVEREKKKEAERVAATEPPPEPTPPEPTAPTPPQHDDPDELLMKARKLDQERDYAGAFEVYKMLADQNPDTEYARVALARLKELKADPRARQAMADAAGAAECKRYLTRARNYALAKMPERAIAEYTAIITRFPDTSFADVARRELRRLQPRE